MKTIAWLCAAIVLTVPVTAADPPGFAMWRASDLKAHEAELAKHVGADHSSRETLADYKDHRFRMLYRDSDGNPEQHDAIVDVVMVQSGEGTLVLGGTMAGRRATSPGEWLGTTLDGGGATGGPVVTSRAAAPGESQHSAHFTDARPPARRGIVFAKSATRARRLIPLCDGAYVSDAQRCR